MKTLILILSAFLLTSCSNPDTSGGVTLSRGGGDDANEFPNGSCVGPYENTPDLDTGCGWITGDEASYYIMPGADLYGANLMAANLSYANLSRTDLRGAKLGAPSGGPASLSGTNLSGADLSGAKLGGVTATRSTICPNGINRRTAGHDSLF